MKVFKAIFNGVYPVGNCLIIAAESMMQANKIAKETIVHTDKFTVEEVDLSKPGVIVYLPGDY